MHLCLPVSSKCREALHLLFHQQHRFDLCMQCREGTKQNTTITHFPIAFR